MMGAPGRQPARKVAAASKLCAPTPGINSGKVKAAVRTQFAEWLAHLLQHGAWWFIKVKVHL